MFLAPAFLLGLLAIGLPLWLHRVARANPTQHQFASLMLLEASETQRTAKRTLRYWLLLITRILLLIVLALAFAGPLLPSRMMPQPNANAHLHAILLDTSLSMRHGDRWARALAEAEEILDSLPSSDRVMLWTAAGRRVVPLNPNTTATDAGTIRAALRALQPGIERLDYGYAMSTANSWLGSPRPPVTLHLISDMQRSAAPMRFADLQLPPQTQLVTHDIGGDTAGNTFIADARLPNRDTRSLEINIGNSVNQVQQRQVIVRIDDKELARKTVTIAAAASEPETIAGEGGSAQTGEIVVGASTSAFSKVMFSDVNLSAGAHRLEVVLEPADELPQDDRFYAVVEQDDPSALLISRDTEADDAAYFAAAIGSLSAPRLTVEQRATSALDMSGLGKYSLVVITDPNALSAATARRIRSYVTAGGAALVTLGETLDDNNLLLGDLDVGDTRGRSGKVAEIATTHPVLREAVDWNRVRFFRQRSIQLTPADQVLIALDDGTPLLIERTLETGHMLILTVPVDRRWNDLAIHPLFVHFIGAAASYLTHAGATANSAIVGSPVATGLTNDGGGQIFDPQGRRALALGQSTIESLLPDQTGFYEIRGSEGARWLAVNVDSRESNLATLPADFIARWQALRVQEPVSAVAATTVAESTPRSLGPWLLWLVACLFVAEVLLANRHLAIRREVPK
ncbi:MAG: BatA and WFA domain-containing protein [Steroidobacter sp.]